MQEKDMSDSRGLDIMIEADQVVKDYWSPRGKYRALNDVSFNLKKGRVLGLLGPNGAGKTTLIKLILGLVKCNQGRVQVMGQSKVNSAVKQKIGFMPEESYLYPFLTVKETVEFSMKLYKNYKSRRNALTETLERVGMDKFVHRKISECSKGMARRTTLAQAMVHDPDLILLDEPTSGFDPMGIAEMKNIIRDLKADGKSILLCSHQLSDVEDVCDDIVILVGGHVVAKGELNELLTEGSKQAYIVEDELKLEALLKESNLSYSTQSTGRLENFFIEKVRSWSKSS